MMKFFDIVRMFILELLIGLILYYFLINNLKIVEFIASILFMPKMTWLEYVKIFGLPVTILTLNYNFGDEILNPSDKEIRYKLKNFPLYWKLKNRVWYSIIISCLIIVGTIFCWYYAVTTNDIVYSTMMILILWGISLTTFLSMAIAKLSLKDILY